MGSALSVSRLMDEACEVAGAHEWGDLAFTGTLDLLLSSCARTAFLNPTGERVLARVVVRHLANRLLLHAYLSRHPGVTGERLGPGVVVTGLPRTGTTLLHNLLALDPNSRVLRFWEALRPVPPDPEGPFSEAGLKEQAARWLERLYELIPSFRAVHAASPQGPEECDALLQNEFASQHFDDMFNAEAYSEWLGGASLRREYASYANQLRVIRRPRDTGRVWTLKSPSHLGHLEALIDIWPEVTIVHCHRHPSEAVPSYASLVLTLRSAYSEQASPAGIGRQALRRCELAMARALEVRAANAGRFVDVSYGRLLHDPVGAVQELYAALDRAAPAGFDTEMERWLAGHPQHRHGVHRYSLDQFGLSVGRVEEAFGDYIERFADFV